MESSLLSVFADYICADMTGMAGKRGLLYLRAQIFRAAFHCDLTQMCPSREMNGGMGREMGRRST